MILVIIRLMARGIFKSRNDAIRFMKLLITERYFDSVDYKDLTAATSTDRITENFRITKRKHFVFKLFKCIIVKL